MSTRAVLAAVAGFICVVLCVAGCRARQQDPAEAPAANTSVAGSHQAKAADKGLPPVDEAVKVAPPAAADKGTSAPDTPQESLETATVQPGEGYEVCLRENRTTAYKWEYEMDPPGGAVVLSDEFIPDPNPQKAVGTGGTHVWAFNLSKPGQVTITFELGANGKDIVRRKTCVLTLAQ